MHGTQVVVGFRKKDSDGNEIVVATTVIVGNYGEFKDSNEIVKELSADGIPRTREVGELYEVHKRFWKFFEGREVHQGTMPEILCKFMDRADDGKWYSSAILLNYYGYIHYIVGKFEQSLTSVEYDPEERNEC